MNYDFNDEVITIATIKATDGFVKGSKVVKASEHMRNGSCLKWDSTASFLECAKVGEEDKVVGVLDCSRFKNWRSEIYNDDELLATVAQTGLILNRNAVYFLKADGSDNVLITPEQETTLKRKLFCKFASIQNDKSVA